MDVRCERCGTEYELDDLLLSPNGTAVRCGQCRFAFRVRPTSDVPSRWIVFRDDGLRLEVDSLSDLCKRIRSGELGDNDEIARTFGSDRRKLGEIDELRESFDYARTQRRPRPRAANEESARERTLAGGKRNQTLPASVLEPGEGAYRPRLPAPMSADESPTPSTPSSSHPRAASRSSLPPPAPPTLRGASERPSGRPAPGPAASTPAVDAPARAVLSLAMDEDLRRPLGASRTFFVGLALVVLATVGVAFAVMRNHVEGRERAHEAVADAVDVKLSLDLDQGYRDAAATLGAEHESAPDDARIVARIAICHSRWAQMLLDEAAFEPSGGRQTLLTTIAREHASEASRFAAHALSIDARLQDAHVGRADALRLEGNLDTAEAELRTAATLGSTASTESLRVAAAIAAQRSSHGTEANTSGERALAAARGDAQVVVLLARAAFVRRDITAFDRYLADLGRVSPEHHAIRYLAAARNELIAPEVPSP